ncbi:MAG: hypothetical protein ACYDDA_15190 [Acidiferrobacteraceae bacterium]
MTEKKEDLSVERLAREYPPADRGLGILVLREHAHISAARAHKWSWGEIAAGLGLDRSRAKGLALSFKRVQARITAGTLVAPETPQARKPGRPQPPATPPAPSTAVEDPDVFMKRFSISKKEL